MVVRLAGLLGKNLGPGVLRVVEDERDELHQRLFGFVARGVRAAHGRGTRPSAAATEEREEILFEDKAEDQQDQGATDANVRAAQLKASATAAGLVATIFDVLTFLAGRP